MRTLLTLLLSVVFGLLFLINSPELAISPGKLNLAHKTLSDDCLACHTPLEGVSRSKCVVCHNIDKIGLQKVDGTLILNKNNKINFHAKLSNPDCSICHKEHRYLLDNPGVINFEHNLLPETTLNSCSVCHIPSKPDNIVHMSISADCGSCHNTTAWKEANFNHNNLLGNINECISCHLSQKPSDMIHKGLLNTKNTCSTCHTTNSWKPSTFKHEKFAFDKNHPSKCINCHEPELSFENYTCYSCHEHNERKLLNEHREEGISNIENCVKCHPSGNEHDIKHSSEKRNKKTRKQGKRDHGKEHDEDDD